MALELYEHAVPSAVVRFPSASTRPRHSSCVHCWPEMLPHSPGRSDQCPTQLTPPSLPSSTGASPSAAGGAERDAASFPSRFSSVLRLLSPSESAPLPLQCTRRL